METYSTIRQRGARHHVQTIIAAGGGMAVCLASFGLLPPRFTPPGAVAAGAVVGIVGGAMVLAALRRRLRDAEQRARAFADELRTVRRGYREQRQQVSLLEHEVTRQRTKATQQTRVVQAAQSAAEKASATLEVVLASLRSQARGTAEHTAAAVAAIRNDGDAVLRTELVRIEQYQIDLIHWSEDLHELLVLDQSPPVDSTTFDPCQLAWDMVRELRREAELRRIEVKLEFASALPSSVCADATKIGRALQGLLRHVIHLSEPGICIVRVGHEHQDNAVDDCLQVEIVGRLIAQAPARQQAQAFGEHPERPVRGAEALVAAGPRFELTKRFIRCLNGRLTWEEAVDDSITVRLDIPVGRMAAATLREAITEESLLAAEEPRAGQECAAVVSAPWRVLVVARGADEESDVATLVQNAGAHVERIENGLAAVEAVGATVAAELPFDTIVMSMDLPVLDGFEATRQLRQRGFQGAILAVAGEHARGEDCLAAGCDDYVARPLDPVELIEKIDFWCLAQATVRNVGRDTPAVDTTC